jgi:predicted nucleic acid-binding protein
LEINLINPIKGLIEKLISFWTFWLGINLINEIRDLIKEISKFGV